MSDDSTLHNTSTKADSPHRHISFTAHYTGYIWFQEGISHAALASSKGRWLAKLVSPLENWAELIIGDSMRTTLRQRHRLIDRQLDHFLAEHPDAQVLEIATGLSPRGWRYRQKYPNLVYVEADLPDMAAAKRQALSQIETPAPRIEAVDLFGEGFQHLLESFDSKKPLVIISEGLVNYFTKDMLNDLWTRLATGLKQFSIGVYITDLYPEPVTRRLARVIWNSSKILKVMSRSAFSFHFVSPTEVVNAMQFAGFSQSHVFQPSDKEITPENENRQDTEHLGDLVWVIESRV
ncbi:MAG: class I SAM-dependent methyltransferase [Aquirhabdus sp.]